MSSFRSLVLILGACLLVSACAEDAPPPAPLADMMPSSPTYVRMAPTPPPPQKAEMPQDVNDARSQIWRPGYWSYGDLGYEWIPGRVIDRPAPTAVWSPDHWAQHTYGWAFECGHWE